MLTDRLISPIPRPTLRAGRGTMTRRQSPDRPLRVGGTGIQRVIDAVAVADLHPGEVVLDLGSGGGIDVLLSARRVGATGKAYGVDFTPEMLDLARRNAAEAGATNVEFLEGRIDAVPLPDESVDVIISNCVVNLAVDKAAVFTEMQRLLRPGGRIGISDVVTEDRLSAAERAERQLVGCIAGALPCPTTGPDSKRPAGRRDDRVHPRRG